MVELSSLIISILPYAIGAAVSPPILVTLLATVSPTKSPRLASFSYLVGSIIFFLIIAFTGMYIGSGLSGSLPMPVQIGGVIEVVLGSILIIIALKTIIVREEPRNRGVIDFITSLRENNNFSVFIKFFYIGFLAFLASFTTDILILQAGNIIGLSNPVFGLAATTVLVLGVITLLVVEVPFIIYLIFSRRTSEMLAPALSWAVHYGDYLTTIVYLILGFFFIIRGSLFV
jgi:hypothetical protein